MYYTFAKKLNKKDFKRYLFELEWENKFIPWDKYWRLKEKMLDKLKIKEYNGRQLGT